jgi:putative membrane protein
MISLVVRILVNAVVLWIAAYVTNAVVPPDWGVIRGLDDPVSILLAALVVGVVNALIRPIVLMLTCLLQLLTLGLFTLVVNALMLLLASWLAEALGLSFRVTGFGAAFVAAILMSVVSMLLTRVVR